MLTPNMRCVDTPSRTHILRIFSLPFFFSKHDFLASAIFMTGRGGLLQLLDMSLSPCCPYHPAGVS
jgi:hypothetical protein